MPSPKTVVEIYEPWSQRTSIRTFAVSPVLVGSSPSSGLQLEDPSVAPLHGEIWSGDHLLAFGNLASKTWLNDHRLDVGTLAPLGDKSVLMVGPYFLTVYPLRQRRPERPAAEVGPPGETFDAWLARSTKVLARAVSVLTEFADAFIDLKERLILPTASILESINDPDDLLAYLLDPSAPDARIQELRSDLDILVRRARRIDVALPRD